MHSQAKVKSNPKAPARGAELPVFGNLGGILVSETSVWAGAGLAPAAVAAAGVASSVAGVLLSATAGFRSPGAWPVTATLDAISVFGDSTIFSAETVIPFLKSCTEAGCPLMLNL